MKKVKKSDIPPLLKQYAEKNPKARWETDFKNDCQDGYQEVISQIKSDQGGLCCYCEIDFGKDEILDDFRVEHFHPKSDRTSNNSWDIDWKNLFGCCHGGSEKYVISQTRYVYEHHQRHCDILKGDSIWDDVILNPMEVPAFPPIFDVLPSSGEMKVRDTCPLELKQKAQNTLNPIMINLNSPYMNNMRKAVIEKLRDGIQELISNGIDISDAVNTIVKAQLSRDSQGNFPRFFSTIRSYLKQDADLLLKESGYDG